MTNSELIYSLKQELISKNENPIIAHWIFLYFNNLASTEEMISILSQDSTTTQQCQLALNKYLYEGQPLARILKETYFYNNMFKVLDNVFCPRLETEILVDKVLNYIQNKGHLKILDMCCGTGIIGLSIAKNSNLTNEVYLVDISSDAISNTKENVKLLDCQNTKVIQSDLFTNIPNIKFDVIVSNPPYISTLEEIGQEVIQYDPYNALFADNNGYAIYEAIINNINQYTNGKQYLIAFEIGYLQAEYIQELLLNFDKDLNIEIIKDYNKLNRVIIARKNFNV